MNKFELITLILFICSSLMLAYLFYSAIKFKKIKEANSLDSVEHKFEPMTKRSNLLIFIAICVIMLPIILFFQITMGASPGKKILFYSIDIFFIYLVVFIVVISSSAWKFYAADTRDIIFLIRDKFIKIPKTEIIQMRILSPAEGEKMIFEKRYGLPEGSPILIGTRKDLQSTFTRYLSVQVTETSNRGISKKINLGVDVVLIELKNQSQFLVSPKNPETFCRLAGF